MYKSDSHGPVLIMSGNDGLDLTLYTTMNEECLTTENSSQRYFPMIILP